MTKTKPMTAPKKPMKKQPSAIEPFKADKNELQTAKNRRTRAAKKIIRCPFCKKELDARQIQSAAAALAGSAGTGLSKTRSKSHYSRIAKVRWSKQKSVPNPKNSPVPKWD
jgi:hypothetical protein